MILLFLPSSVLGIEYYNINMLKRSYNLSSCVDLLLWVSVEGHGAIIVDSN